MSAFGFGKVSAKVERQQKVALRRCMDAAQKTFDANFETESVDGQAWDPVLRGYPPPILDVTGNLRAMVADKSNVTIGGDRATLTIDPTDDRGRGYAEYHDEGTPDMPARPFAVQTDELTAEQEEIILATIENSFV